ncbi:hypothetical protein [Bosea sp. (in: a-proteobacteria)]|uniref:hypothetical protein n=1 Tax=Bosea sp. (in: a-proteobacteria) TaxID=1871050 RepID=UPI0027334835|nr:hypothetical protein [Bosea sp. (in: a-proteobacteria)]MDP3411040.1 hypothetical protein [Bosea sp. (in: a-proteobacteria)]
MNQKSKQRIDADNAFLRVQTQAIVRERLQSEADVAALARDTNTARLKELRLLKEANEREALAARPLSSKMKNPSLP